jgi:DNA-binding YbaB/EbfC family protein
MRGMPQGPGGGNMQKMLKEVQEAQANMEKAQESLQFETVEANAGGGMVKVKMSADLRVKEIAIDPEAIDPDDPEILSELIIAATNQALQQAQDLAAKKLQEAAGPLGGLMGGAGGGGLGLPGL